MTAVSVKTAAPATHRSFARTAALNWNRAACSAEIAGRRCESFPGKKLLLKFMKEKRANRARQNNKRKIK